MPVITHKIKKSVNKRL